MRYVIYGLKLVGHPGYRYVGLTERLLSQRLAGHFSAAKRADRRYGVTDWIRKHGRENIEAVVLEACPIGDKRYLEYAERYWVASLREFGHRLLNHTDGGDGVRGLTAWNKGVPMSPEQLRLLTESRLGMTHNAETRAAISAGVKKHFEENGHKSVVEFWSDRYGEEQAQVLEAERRRKVSQASTGVNNPMYGKGGQLAPCYGRVGDAHPMFGKNHTDEARAKISNATKGKPKSEVTKIRMSFANHTRFHEGRLNPKCRWCLGDSLESVISAKEKELDDTVG